MNDFKSLVSVRIHRKSYKKKKKEKRNRKIFILRISIIVIVILVIFYFIYQALNFRLLTFFFPLVMVNIKKYESRARMPDFWSKKQLIHFALLLWPQPVGRRGTWEWKGQGTISENLCSGCRRTAWKQVWSFSKYCFIPLITSVKPSFTSILESVTEKKRKKGRK